MPRAAQEEELTANLLTIYAKTGTAEVGRKPNLRNNSLLICFATYGKRTYAMVIIVENGTGGGRDCAPLTKEFLKNIFNYRSFYNGEKRQLNHLSQ